MHRFFVRWRSYIRPWPASVEEITPSRLMPSGGEPGAWLHQYQTDMHGLTARDVWKRITAVDPDAVEVKVERIASDEPWERTLWRAARALAGIQVGTLGFRSAALELESVVDLARQKRRQSESESP